MSDKYEIQKETEAELVEYLLKNDTIQELACVTIYNKSPLTLTPAKGYTLARTQFFAQCLADLLRKTVYLKIGKEPKPYSMDEPYEISIELTHTPGQLVRVVNDVYIHPSTLEFWMAEFIKDASEIAGINDPIDHAKR